MRLAKPTAMADVEFGITKVKSRQTNRGWARHAPLSFPVPLPPLLFALDMHF